MDDELISYWAVIYAKAILQNQLQYIDLEISLINANRVKVLNRVRKILNIRESILSFRPALKRKQTTYKRVRGFGSVWLK